MKRKKKKKTSWERLKLLEKDNYKRKKYYTLVVSNKHNWDLIILCITQAKTRNKIPSELPNFPLKQNPKKKTPNYQPNKQTNVLFSITMQTTHKPRP